jgi:hypothetical protein
MNDDSTTLRNIRNILSQDQSSELSPVDKLFLIYLLAHKAEDHYVSPSHETLARHFGCDRRTILRSQERLTAKEIIACVARRGMTNDLTVNVDSLPANATVKTVITDEARQLALRYQTALKRHTGRKRFPKLWLQHQFFNAQRMIDDCAGDVDKAARLIGFALSRPEFKGKAAKSLYELFARWKQLRESYTELKEQKG